MNIFIKKSMTVALLVSLGLLSACNDSDSSKMKDIVEPPPPPPVNYSYEVTITNLTHAQPMSPVAVVLHNDEQLWQLGMMSSVALENLAESGDNSMVLAQSMVLAGQSGADIIMPGMSETIIVTLTDTEPMMLSLATMLVNTNDAFSGVNALSLTNLMVGESISMTTSSYDAGTERNSEMMSTIPGPVAGGEGFNEMRDDVDFVAMHAGVVSVDDGLSTSVLTQAHRFDNPTLAVLITRTE